MIDNRSRLLAILLAILAAAFLRLVPHPPNFGPVGALALFSGAMLGKHWLAFAAPIGALVLSDLVLGFYPELLFVYASVVAIVLLGWVVARRRTALTIAAAAVASSILFFAVTNFGVWLMTDYYSRTLGGLAACYVAAIPFFQNTLASDLFYAGLLFGGFALAERLLPALREPRLASA